MIKAKIMSRDGWSPRLKRREMCLCAEQREHASIEPEHASIELEPEHASIELEPEHASTHL
jgi:hypothetical protein